MSFVMLFLSLYIIALSPIQLPNTALIANSNCSDGSDGNFIPVCFSQIFLYSETTVFRDFSFNALSACTAWFIFAFSKTSSNFLSSTPNTTLPNSWTNLLYESHANLGLLLFFASPSTVSSFNPKFNMVSIIPGMDIAAPDLTDTNNGFSLEFHFFPVLFSIFAIFFFTSGISVFGSFLLFS